MRQDDHAPEVVSPAGVLAVAHVTIVTVDEVDHQAPLLLGVFGAQRRGPLVLPSIGNISIVVDEIGKEIEVVGGLVTEAKLIGLSVTPTINEFTFLLITSFKIRLSSVRGE